MGCHFVSFLVCLRVAFRVLYGTELVGEVWALSGWCLVPVLHSTSFLTKEMSINGENFPHRNHSHNIPTMNTPPRQPPKSEWTTPTRTRVLTLLETRLSQLEVACETNVPRSTVSRSSRVSRGRRTTSRTGCPRQLTKHDIRRLIGRLRSRGEEGRELCYRRLG